MKNLRIGTRQSQLALTQTKHVAALLENAWPGLACELVRFVTKGDKTLDKPLAQIGGKGLFTLELEQALHNGEIDLAVHSLKDLPVEQPSGLTLGAIPERETTADVLIAKNGWTLATLPGGAVVGTSSPRRKAQLLSLRPDLNIISIRGNIDTRIRKTLKADEYDAVILAKAGVRRLGLENLVTDDNLGLLPAPGQGALGVQCRADDHETLEFLRAIHCLDVAACVTAERDFLARLGGGCSAPIAALAQEKDATFELSAWVGNANATEYLHDQNSGSDSAVISGELAASFRERGVDQFLNGAESSVSEKRRIIVTRSAEQSGEFAKKLRARGLEPLVCPTITFEALPAEPLLAALKNFSKYDIIIFTSANAVRFFEATAQSFQLDFSQRPQIAVVGDATTASLPERYGAPDFVPEKFTAENLALSLGDIKGQRILLPRAKIGRPQIVDILQERGASVDDIPLYDTVPVEPTSAIVSELKNGFDSVTFSSPSSVRNFMRILENTGLKLRPETVVACIGPSTAEEAEKFGLLVAIMPEKYTIDALADAIARHFK